MIMARVSSAVTLRLFPLRIDSGALLDGRPGTAGDRARRVTAGQWMRRPCASGMPDLRKK